MNLMHDLRRREDLSQQELAKATHLTANDISRCEHHARVGMDKFITLAAYFHVTVDALVMNNYSTVFSKMTAPVKPTHRNSLRMERISARRYELGRLGEEWVFRQEIRKLAGTPYANAVNPNYANETSAGFDIRSYDMDGDPILIEVKTTRGDAEERFVMTEAECRKAGECLKEGIRYEIHRVFRYGTPRAGRVIIPAEELFRDYNFRVSDYMVQRRWSA